MVDTTLYLIGISETFKSGGREESYYPYLKSLLESYDSSVRVIVAPQREEFGFPDFKVVRANGEIIGYIEAKRPGVSLDEVETSEQIRRYLQFIPNLILTDFVEFRLYRDGKLFKTAKIAINNLKTIGKLTPISKGVEELEDLLQTFLRYNIPPVKNIQRLAKALAVRSRVLREAFSRNLQNRVIRDIYDVLKDTLLPNLEEDLFTDIFAQTITYSLIIGRINAGGEKIALENVAGYIPTKLKVIRAILGILTAEKQAGGDIPDEVKWAIEDIINVINSYAGTLNYGDLAIHFYEPFLKEYNPNLREIRGVYYTPKEVVGFINRSVDAILEEIGYEGGFTNEEVKVLDPCAGTTSFIVDIAKRAVERYREAWGSAAVKTFIDAHILEDFYAFELLVAPYVIGHLILEAFLKSQGYEDNKVFKLYLTNTLSEPKGAKHEKGLLFREILTQEKFEADRVKEREPIIAIVGNPPYSGISANMNEWIDGMLKRDIEVDGEVIQSYYKVDGKPLGERKLWLQDDYVKFIRFAQWKVAKTGRGIVGFITNHAYLDNPTFRGMRQSLLKSFDRIYMLNLHGNVRKREGDENVFDIQQGVAVGIFVKDGSKEGEYARVFYFSTLEEGLKKREEKLSFLENISLEDLKWKEIKPISPFYFFVPTGITPELREEYERGWKVLEIFKEGSTGIVTARDKLVIDFDKDALLRKIEVFSSPDYTDDDVKRLFKVRNNYQWRVEKAREELREALKKYSPESFLQPILYRPFDIRWIFYHPSVVWRTRIDVMIHMLRGKNLALITSRLTKGENFRHVQVSRVIVEVISLSSKTSNNAFVFPLYLYLPKGHSDRQNFLKHKEKITFPIKPDPEKYERVPNFTQEFQNFLKEKYGDQISPEEVFNYIYAILYHPEYRTRYAEFLKYDFPRIPFPEDYKTLKKFAEYGEKLVKLHLLDFKLSRPTVRFEGDGDDMIRRVKYDPDTRRLWINGTQYIAPVRPEVWEYMIGGYQVLQKWLKGRKGRRLDFPTFAKIVYAIEETIRLQEELEKEPLPTAHT